MSGNFTTEVLRVFDECDCHTDLFWRTSGDELRLLAACSDWFYWACADAEEITPADLPLLRSCADDLLAIERSSTEKSARTFRGAGAYVGQLCACRKRGMRPM